MTVIKKVKSSRISELLRGIKDTTLADSPIESIALAIFFIMIVILSIGMVMHKSTCEKSEDVIPKYGCDVAGPKYLSEHKGVCVTVQKT